MNSKTLSFVLTVASLSALCAPVLAADKPVEPEKSTVASTKSTTAKPGVLKKAHKGARKNDVKSAAIKSAK